MRPAKGVSIGYLDVFEGAVPTDIVAAAAILWQTLLGRCRKNASGGGQPVAVNSQESEQ
jgi:hypothetical protein